MSNYTILLIDYEPRSIERVRRPLEAAGYTVEVATDGLAGIEAFQKIQPCLVLVEAMIPKKHGFEVCQDLKKSPAGKKVPVIITTAVYKGRKYRNQAVHLYGCDDYLEKPLADDQLLSAVSRFVGSPAGAAAPAVAVGGASAPAASRIADPEDEITARLDAILPGGSPLAASNDEDEDVVVLVDDEDTPRTASAEVISFESHRAKRMASASSGVRRTGGSPQAAEAILPQDVPETVVPGPLPQAAPERAPEPEALSTQGAGRLPWVLGAIVIVCVLVWLAATAL